MQDYSDKRFLVVDDFNDFLSSVKAMLREMGRVTWIPPTVARKPSPCAGRSSATTSSLHDYNLAPARTASRCSRS